jgi:hypothetical protein
MRDVRLSGNPVERKAAFRYGTSCSGSTLVLPVGAQITIRSMPISVSELLLEMLPSQHEHAHAFGTLHYWEMTDCLGI